MAKIIGQGEITLFDLPEYELEQYYIEINQDEILRFVSEEGIKFSPGEISFSVYRLPMTQDTPALDIIKYDLQVLIDGSYISLKDKIPESINYNELNEETDFKKVYLSIGTCFAQSEQSFPELREKLENLDTNCQFKFLFLDENDNELAIKILECRNGLTSDMANFNINAADITAAIQNTKLTFSADGLKITNGGFKIVNDNEEEVFTADEDGNLIIKGIIQADGGYFNGDITGSTGTFSGTLQAKEGLIGGFKINENSLYSNEDEPNLILNGNTGLVIAKNIQLAGAKVTGIIELGSASLKNPDANFGIILEADKVKLNENGNLQLGSIQYNSSNDILYSTNWQLKGNGQAIFNEVIADSIIQKNSVLEIGTIQSVGSLMLFKDSWMIYSSTGKEIILEKGENEGNINLKADDWIYCDKKAYKIKTITEKDNFITITLYTTPTTNLSKKPMAKFGKADQDFILSALGEKTEHFAYAQGNSITLSDFTEYGDIEEQKQLLYNKRLVLGQLTGINNDSSIKGIGLYCDNVFLKGSLTTQSKTNKYAGVNTISEVPFNSSLIDYKINDNSNIVFWAGARENTLESIQQSPFQVTEAGTIYAQQAYLTKSIFIEGTIRGADIYAARIHGSDLEQNPAALSIYDTGIGTGISFMTGYKDEENLGEETFSIKSTGFYKDGKYFIDISNSSISFQGNYFKAINSYEQYIQTDNIEFLTLQKQGLYYQSENENNSQSLSGISIFKDKISIAFSNQTSQEDLNDQAIFTKEKTEIKNNFQANNDVQFGTSIYLKYQQVEKGYDLYVYS